MAFPDTEVLSLPRTTAFAIHYPGYPSSISRAVQTLGGLPAISKVRNSNSRPMELRFRPEDPYSIPTFGELRACSALLLRISKTKGSEEPESVSVDVVARVSRSYQFEGIADYQHVVAVHAAEAKNRKRPFISDSELASEKSSLVDWYDSIDVMMMVPQLFSHKRTPQNVMLNPPANLFSRNMQRGLVKHRWEMDIEPCLALDIKIERIPVKVDWENNVTKDSMEWEWQAAVSRLFDLRPIWPRWSLHERLLEDGLMVPENYLKRLLLRTGYYFNTGPFRHLFIRKGYDPRVDPESRVYQRIEIRIPCPLRKSGTEGRNCELKQSWKDLCKFKVFPSKKINYFQLFELDDDFIQDEIRKPPMRSSCSQVTGWFSVAMHKALLLRVKMRFMPLCTDENAKDKFNSVQMAFMKAKKEVAREEAIKKRPMPNKECSDASEGANDLEKSPSSKTDVFVLEQGPEDQELEDGLHNFDVGDEEDEEEEDEYQSPLPAEGEEDYFSLDPGARIL